MTIYFSNITFMFRMTHFQSQNPSCDWFFFSFFKNRLKKQIYSSFFTSLTDSGDSSLIQVELIRELLRLTILSTFSANGLDLNIDWLWFQKYLSNLVNLIWSNPKLASLILEGMVQEVVMIFPMPKRKKRKHRVGTCHVESSS